MKEHEEIKPLGFGDLGEDDMYCTIIYNNKSDQFVFENDTTDLERLAMGNAFRTKEEAEAYRPKYLRKLEILEWLHKHRDFNKNHYILWDIERKKPSNNVNFDFLLNNYPLSAEDANKAIYLFENDLKLIFEL